MVKEGKDDFMGSVSIPLKVLLCGNKFLFINMMSLQEVVKT